MRNIKPTTILAIETSCDETAFSILQNGKTLSHQVHTQISVHAEFGGVFPALAKREHDKNFTPVLAATLHEAFGIAIPSADASTNHNLDEEMINSIRAFLTREDGLAADLIAYFQNMPHEDFIKIKSSLSGIAVTYGPGLEPALWVGISGAKALATLFTLPLYPINHMEGHIASVLASAHPSTVTTGPQDALVASGQEGIPEAIGGSPLIDFPALALLISGGHTELIAINSWHAYAKIGQTVDDAVGEAYDKVARLMGLQYPGGPQISKLAEKWRSEHASAGLAQTEQDKSAAQLFSLPRPMIHTKDYNFSFSGLKTAALYAVRDKLADPAQNNEPLRDKQKEALAAEFEQAVTDTLLHKTKRAIEEYGAKTLIIGGGVIANSFIRKNFTTACAQLGIALFIPEKDLSTDNATMIGLVSYFQIRDGKPGLVPGTPEFDNLRADGNLSL